MLPQKEKTKIHGENASFWKVLVQAVTVTAAALLLLDMLGLRDLGWTEFERHAAEGTLHAKEIWEGTGLILLWLSNKWAPASEVVALGGGAIILLWQKVFHIFRLFVATVAVASVLVLLGYIVIKPGATPQPAPIVRPAPPVVSLAPPQPLCPKGEKREGDHCACNPGLVRASNGSCVSAPAVTERSVPTRALPKQMTSPSPPPTPCKSYGYVSFDCQ